MDALGEELPDCSLTHDEIRQIDATIDRVKNSNEQFGKMLLWDFLLRMMLVCFGTFSFGNFTRCPSELSRESNG